MKQVIIGCLLLLTMSCGNRQPQDKTQDETQVQSVAAREWTAIAASEIKDNPVTLIGGGMALAVGTAEKMNAMTIGWGGLGTLWTLTNPVVTVYIRDDRYTRELLDANELFTLTVFPEELRKRTNNYFGTHSGRATDKMKGSGLTVRFTEQGTPYFDEGRLTLECRKIYSAPFSAAGFGDSPKGNTPKDGYGERFVIYIGEVVNVWEKQ